MHNLLKPGNSCVLYIYTASVYVLHNQTSRTYDRIYDDAPDIVPLHGDANINVLYNYMPCCFMMSYDVMPTS